MLHALESYKARLRGRFAQTQQRLGEFEQRYGITTQHFLSRLTADDLGGGDIEYVEWAGEAKILAGLERELSELEHARYQLP